MSAFVVNDDHIKELAAFAVSERPGRNEGVRVNPQYLRFHISPETNLMLMNEQGNYLTGTDLATVYAGILYSENIRSVETRYPEDTFDDLPGLVQKPAHIVVTTRDIMNRQVKNPVHILSMCACLAYQSCETEDWEKTDAFALLQAIKEAAIRCLPGYDDAPWEYNKDSYNKKTRVA